MEVARIIPQGRISERTVVQTDDVPVPQTLEEVVEVVNAVKIVSQERISAKICEQIVGAPFHMPWTSSFPRFRRKLLR